MDAPSDDNLSDTQADVDEEFQPTLDTEPDTIDDINDDLTAQDIDDDGDVQGQSGSNQADYSSGGFVFPDDEDPFTFKRGSTNSGRSNGLQSLETDDPIQNTNQSTKGSGESSSVPTKDTSSRVRKSKHRASKAKPFKIINPGRPGSADSADLDPEEEKLKLLPDCCEYTARHGHAFEDEGRKQMCSAWFKEVKIKPSQLKQLSFSESLLMVEETGVVVGKYYCSVSLSKWNDKQCICVHSGSFGKFSTGLEAGTSITSFITFKLEPLQEFVHEWATMNSEIIERKTFVMKELERMPVKITVSKNGKLLDTKTTNLGIKERENLVTEGINLLLLRLLILERRTTSSMNLQALTYKGNVVRCKYSELGSGWENVKGKQIKTWGIRRNVYVSEEEERVWDSLFNKNSRLILRCQPDGPQALIPLWFETIVEFDKHGNFSGSYAPYAWACDMELYSKYAIRKEEITHDHRRYIIDHPEVRALLSDYLQAVLFRKPQNVIDFTKQYFEAFVNLRGKQRKSNNSSSDDYYFSGSSGSRDDDLDEGEWPGEGEDERHSNPVIDDNSREAAGVQSKGVSTGYNADDELGNEEGQYVSQEEENPNADVEVGNEEEQDESQEEEYPNVGDELGNEEDQEEEYPNE